MRLDQALVSRRLCESRTEAQELIGRGVVFVNGEAILKQTKQVGNEDDIAVTGRRTYVSRGGEKLHGILQDIYGEDEVIKEYLEGKTALDIGSSTGGFTDCLLSFGIRHVDAVDVGTDQLHSKLRLDPRVSLYESTDIRSFETQTKYDIVVADLSFISLETVFDAITSFGKEDTEYFLLIKPQFEVGKGNTKKGIVKDGELVIELLKKYEVIGKLHGFTGIQILPCHIQGGDGNQEFFLYGKIS